MIFNKDKGVFLPNRLRFAFDNAVSFPVSVIAAEAGYGKTTAVNEYIIKEEKAGKRCLRYTCMVSEPNYAWKSICRLICEIDNPVGRKLLELSEPTYDNISDISFEIEQIRCDIPTLLVIDNFHKINPDVEALIIEAFSVHSCKKLHIMILTRQCFKSTYILNQRIYLIDDVTLALRDSEIESLIWKFLDEDARRLMIILSMFDKLTLYQLRMLCNYKKMENDVLPILRSMPYIIYDEVGDAYTVQNVLRKFLDVKLEQMDYVEIKKLYISMAKACEEQYVWQAVKQKPLIALRIVLWLFFSGHIYSCRKLLERLCDSVEAKFVGTVIEFPSVDMMLDVCKEASLSCNHISEIYTMRNAWCCGCPSILGILWSEGANLHEIRSSFDEYLKYYQKIKYGHGISADILLDAEISYMKGDYEYAGRLCLEAVNVSQRLRQDSLSIIGEFVLARIAVLQGDMGALLMSMGNIRTELNSGYEYECPQLAQLCVDSINLQLGRYDEISAWMRDRYEIEQRINYPAVPFAHIIYAVLMYRRFQMGAIDSDKYLRILMELHVESDEHHVLLPKIYYYIFEAVVRDNIGDVVGACSILEKALDYAIVDEIYMPFAECYRFIWQILERITESCIRYSKIHDIEMLGRMFNNGRKIISANGYKSKESCLSRRELEIVGMLRRRMTSREIADKLRISVNTVRNITQSIYNKLEIHSKKELTDIT